MSHSFKTTVGYTAVVLAFALPNIVLAEDSPADREFNKRLYIGAGIGATELEPESSTKSLSVSDKSSNSYNVTVGYDISPRLAVDAYASNLGKAGVSFLGEEVDEVDYAVYGVSLVGYLSNAGSPYSDTYDNDGLYQREGLSTYLRVGVGGMTNDSKKVEYKRDHTTHFASGIGMEYGWSNGVALRAEVSAYDTDARKLSVSALKRIGEASYANAAAAAAPAIIPTAAAKSLKPKPIARPIDVSPVLEKPLVLFAFDEIGVKEEYINSLDLLAASLLKHQQIEVQIDGHTDWVGSGAYNMNLSERRADSVREYLIDHGVEPHRLHSTGYGEHLPLADNNNEEGRSRNRRVEISRLR